MAAIVVEAWRIEGDSCMDNFDKAADDVERVEGGCIVDVLADHWGAELLVEPAAGLDEEDSWPKPEGEGFVGPPADRVSLSQWRFCKVPDSRHAESCTLMLLAAVMI